MASIRERTSTATGTTWQVLYRHGNKQASRTFKDEKKATKFKGLVELLGPDRALVELFADGKPNRLTVDELAQQFLEWKATGPKKVTPRTLTDYRRDVANWIEPWFGHRAAESIDERDVQKWVDHMAGKLSPKSVADRHMLLHSIYEYGRARTRRLVEHNPCKESELPRKVKAPPKGTTVPEFRAVLEVASKRNLDAHDFILFLGETGWRFSEAAALDVAHVEDDGTDVWVDMTQVFRLDGSGRQVLTLDAAKSRAGFRRIRLFPDSAAAVRRRVVGKAPSDLVFTNSRGNHWNQNTFLRETWPRIIAAAELGERKPTPHWLRHMHVAVLAAAGVPMQEIQRRIGHENISTTIGVYGGMIGDISDDSLDRAHAIMTGKRSAPNVAEIVTGEVVAQVLEITEGPATP